LKIIAFAEHKTEQLSIISVLYQLKKKKIVIGGLIKNN